MRTISSVSATKQTTSEYQMRITQTKFRADDTQKVKAALEHKESELIKHLAMTQAREKKVLETLKKVKINSPHKLNNSGSI